MNRLIATALWAGLTFGLVGCGGSSVGHSCSVNDDCDNGQTCFVEAPGGFCSKGCSQEGNEKECPGGTVCASHSGTLLCSPTCDTQAGCRAEYECNGLPGSDLKACRPKA